MKIRILVFAVAAAFAAPCLFAQLREGTVEIEPFAGYLWGGQFDRGTTSIFDQKVDVEDHFTYGGRIGYNLTSLVEFEAMFQRTETNFETHTSSSGPIFGPPGQTVRLGQLDIDYYMGYTTFNFGHGRAVPYVSFGLGAARLDPNVATAPGASTDTRFTSSVAGGLKVFFNPHFGMRFDGRYFGTVLNDHGCNCSHSTWLSNWSTTGGILFAF
ncbi:MAG TPA: outer membrane beta-barrel protein [Thermoanaerobaculia bacterium]|nr:outer membrane beta-barrel protein [Thermoanaerobaculia bacterium]